MEYTKQEELFDKFAGQALQALIAKAPFFDIDGTQGKKVTLEELQQIKKDLASTAYEYASYMLIARYESMNWLKENKDHFTTLSQTEAQEG